MSGLTVDLAISGNNSTMTNGYYSGNTGQRQTNWLLPLLLVGLLLVLAAGAGTYFWQQRTIDKRNATISDLKVQLLKAQTQSQSAATPQPSTTPPPATNFTSTKGVQVTVYAPSSGGKVASPVAVIGEVPGNWSFEASFPVDLKDSTGKVIATTNAHVLGNWMTSSLVPFSASLTYSGSPSGNGTLVLRKDNPSGQSSNDDQVTIPVNF